MKAKFDMQKARDGLEQTKTFIVRSVPNQTGYGMDHSRHPNLTAIQLVCDVHMPAALDRIEEMQSTVEKFGKKIMRQEANLLRVIGRNRDQRERIAELEGLNNDLMQNGNDLRTRSQKAESENAKLRDALVEERAIRILDSEEKKFALAKVDHCPHVCASCDDDCSIDWCPSKKLWMSIAREQLEKEGLL